MKKILFLIIIIIIAYSCNKHVYTYKFSNEFKMEFENDLEQSVLDGFYDNDTTIKHKNFILESNLRF